MSDLAPAEIKIPWASFCMSTYKRPVFLEKQISSLLQQTFTDFEIIISDNDPEESAGEVVKAFNSPKIKYYANGENLGMIKSYNRSIERSTAEYIVMITDDDPVDVDFLATFFNITSQLPGYSLYGGFGRVGKEVNSIERIPADTFLIEILDPDKTNNLLWSSCVVKRADLVSVGMLPDYGSPHLFDHAMLAMTGSLHGGVVMNKMYSEYILHDQNFSKSNLQSYFVSCTGFYDTLSSFCRTRPFEKENFNIIKQHLGKWFIVNHFSLRKYFSTKKNLNKEKLDELKKLSTDVLKLPFMKHIALKFHLKSFIFFIKKQAGII